MNNAATIFSYNNCLDIDLNKFYFRSLLIVQRRKQTNQLSAIQTTSVKIPDTCLIVSHLKGSIARGGSIFLETEKGLHRKHVYVLA